MRYILKGFVLIFAITNYCNLIGQTSPQLLYPQFRAKLDSVVTTSYNLQHRYYHFARLYQRTSDEVDVYARQGKLNDTAFITAIETVFGYYYLSNLDSVKNGMVKSYSWGKAFDTAKHSNTFASSLILSINAHVSQDLFFALTEVFKKYPPNRKRKQDFKTVTHIHDKIFADYVENTLPHLQANKKWERQLLRNIGKRAAKAMYRERMKVWKQAAKAYKSDKKFTKYSNRRMKWAKSYADLLIEPKGIVKEGLVIANMLNNMTFEEKAFLINNKRP